MESSLERPDEHAADLKREVYCWLPANADRECNTACPAFDMRCLQDASMVPCTVLNTMKSIGISLARLSQVFAAGAGPRPPAVMPGGK